MSRLAVELHVSGYFTDERDRPFPVLFGRQVKALGGKFSECRGHTSTRFVTVPYTKAGLALADAIIRATRDRDVRNAEQCGVPTRFISCSAIMVRGMPAKSLFGGANTIHLDARHSTLANSKTFVARKYAADAKYLAEKRRNEARQAAERRVKRDRELLEGGSLEAGERLAGAFLRDALAEG